VEKKVLSFPSLPPAGIEQRIILSVNVTLQLLSTSVACFQAHLGLFVHVFFWIRVKFAQTLHQALQIPSIAYSLA